MKHEETSKKESRTNLNKKQNILQDLKGWRKDGLNSICFKILEVEEIKDNIHRVKVEF